MIWSPVANPRGVTLLKYHKAILTAVALTVLALPLADIAEANGRVIRFERRDAGRYEVALGTIPASPGVGLLHLTLEVIDRGSAEFVPNATLTVTGTGPESDEAEIGPLEVQRSVTDPAFYEVGTSVDREGTWIFNVSVSGDLGDGSADFPVEVRNASPLVGIATLLVMVLLLVVLGLSFRSYLKEGRKGGRPKAKRRA